METQKTKISAYAMPGIGFAEPVTSPKRKFLTSIEIKKIVAHYFNLPVFTLDLKSRKIEIREARQIGHYFARIFTRDSSTVVGKIIGNKDHATVLHSCKTISNLRETDKKLASVLKDIEYYIKIRIKESNGDIKQTY